MIILLITILSLSFIVLLLSLAGVILNWKSNNSRENSSPYECGFDPNSNARIPFSLRFFLLITLFLIFDIEIALLVSIPILTNNLGSFLYFIPLTIFLIVIATGLIHEWNEGSLEWAF